MKLSRKDKLYSRQLGLIGTLYECSPSGFSDTITVGERSALSVYYFTDREIDVDDIFAYGARIRTEDPVLAARAESALRKMAAEFGVDARELELLFDDRLSRC
jgi:hypothetical protein